MIERVNPFGDPKIFQIVLLGAKGIVFKTIQ